MDAYLIDPAARTISEVNMDFSLQSIYSLLGCRLISTVASQPNGDLMFVDDNVADDEHEAFRFGSWEIYSKALVVGSASEGESISPKTPIQFFNAQVYWLRLKTFKPTVAIWPFLIDVFENWPAISIQKTWIGGQLFRLVKWFN
ncbi:hypothetical protein [Spirosoma flavum]|uniref:Uncharacterized protein n=1 Tax=Spirosoma flavum TaxID=2048557 RepID=A0ABW6AQX7_9BACT